jgi:hypothetical protein
MRRMEMMRIIMLRSMGVSQERKRLKRMKKRKQNQKLNKLITQINNKILSSNTRNKLILNKKI